MVKDWQELTRITNGVAFAVERVKLASMTRSSSKQVSSLWK